MIKQINGLNLIDISLAILAVFVKKEHQLTLVECNNH